MILRANPVAFTSRGMMSNNALRASVQVAPGNSNLTQMPVRSFATKKDKDENDLESVAEAPVKKRRGRPPKV